MPEALFATQGSARTPLAPEAFSDLLDALPRVFLAHLPTPIMAVPALSRRLGVDLLVKRDDADGGAEAGNKLRKLELLLARALRDGCDTVITCGGAQSNHAGRRRSRVRASGCRACSSYARAETVPCRSRHVMLDRFAGAELRAITAEEYRDRDRLMHEAGEELTRVGRRPYVIPKADRTGSARSATRSRCARCAGRWTPGSPDPATSTSSSTPADPAAPLLARSSARPSTASVVTCCRSPSATTTHTSQVAFGAFSTTRGRSSACPRSSSSDRGPSTTPRAAGVRRIPSGAAALHGRNVSTVGDGARSRVHGEGDVRARAGGRSRHRAEGISRALPAHRRARRDSSRSPRCSRRSSRRRIRRRLTSRYASAR